jgi:hypothetical protein
MRFESGARLGPFEVLAPVGAGGMGEVYRARDTRLGRTVALKVLPRELQQESGGRVERLRYEARAIARIAHPNICTLYDVGEDGSIVFLVMEYVEGATLARRLEDGPLPLQLSMRTAIGIADALDHAHRHGVVHRDLKPANVMLTRESVKLLDFGLARLTERDHLVPGDPTLSLPLTDRGAVVGTVPYMAPEQIEGGDVDARTDIFAFGVLLYEMVCGRRPFAGDGRASLMAAIVAAEPAAPSSTRPAVPAVLDRVVLRCLAKDPDDRWQTARDLAAELRWVAEGDATRPRAATGGRHRVALWAGVAAAVLAAGVSAALAQWMWPSPAVPNFLAVTYRKGAVSAARFTPDGQNFVYAASWEGGPYRLFLGNPQGSDARDLQIADARILSISDAADMAIAFGPQNITHTVGERTLARIPMGGGARRDLLTGVVAADWIPGTDALAVVRDPGNGRPFTVEFPAGTTVHETKAAWSLRVSPDGSRVAFFEGPVWFESAPSAMVTVIDRSGRKSTLSRNWTGHGLAWAPSGTEVWFTATRPGLHAPHVNAVSLAGVERTVYRAPDWLVLHDISADGRMLLSRNSIRINMACRGPDDTGERDLTWQWASTIKALSSDGRTLIFEDELGVTSSGVPRIFRRSADASAAVLIGDGVGGTLSPDGKWVLARQGDRLVLLPTGPGSSVTLPGADVVRMEDWAWLDANRIVFTGYLQDDTYRVYLQDIPAGGPRAITADGVRLGGKAAVRDENSILGFANARWMLLPVQGGDPRPVPALASQDLPLQWSHNGRFLYTVTKPEGLRGSAIDVFRIELSTGSRRLWNTLTPPDPVGVEDVRESVVITPDARSYCYSFLRRLGDLFVVSGLQ